MYFLILLCHASLYCWKTSIGMALNSVVTNFLMVSTSSKWIHLMIPLSLRKRKKAIWSKIRLIGRLFQYIDVPLDQELQSYYFSDMPKSLVIIFQTLFFFFHVQLIFDHSNYQLTITTHHLLYLDLSHTC